MNAKEILFNYIVENEGYTPIPELELIEEQLINSLSSKQKELFEKYTNEYAKFYNNRIFYYFCKGIEIKL